MVWRAIKVRKVLLAMVELDVDGALFDSAAVWSVFWSVDAEVHGRAIERADFDNREGQRAGVLAVAWRVRYSAAGVKWSGLRISSTVGMLGCIRGGVRDTVERLDVLRPPDISWRCRDLDLAVGLHTMV
ncbi:uncharacterized protein PITG_20244 [Phytophthora infestans T30-4]|uniref:Uncharacterized protein n=1 Tax=Phytophthora infestans (strain T30-4) TaxID=403677 RepID=D0P123_PHYIT|nr:uncharacterized protein PITG_20244 [Phytophthora infestans T30-4]EEY53738.1 conserved hypothetical protein [Phytophthora infestans T30-4]|eukprot:XP_002896001.1 conserved hypothetical protein [Phytophthora infestans T30-4]